MHVRGRPGQLASIAANDGEQPLTSCFSSAHQLRSLQQLPLFLNSQRFNDMTLPKETSPLMHSGRPQNERLPCLFSLARGGAILENTGSTARDHLANERTYLAWMRTSLALLGISLGLLKWDAINNWAGYLVAVMGLVVLITSTKRYFRVMQLLEQGKFEPNVQGIIAIVATVSCAIIAAYVLQHMHQL